MLRSSGMTIPRRYGIESFARSPPVKRLDIVDNARFFAMENLAAADGAIGCWNDKYYWQSWRPITAIREADTDGNPATEADPTWWPLFRRKQHRSVTRRCSLRRPSPNIPRVIARVSSAIVHTLQNFFGTDKIAV